METIPYCPEQHQYICAIEAQLRQLIKEIDKMTSHLSFLEILKLQTEGILEKNVLYHQNYKQWIKNQGE